MRIADRASASIAASTLRVRGIAYLPNGDACGTREQGRRDALRRLA